MGLSWGWLRGVFSGLRTNRRKARSHRVTGLEDRTLLAAFVVNTLLDTVDANPGDGLALDADGNTSLRAAIIEANALAGADTIALSAGVYQFSLPEVEGDFGELFTVNGDLDVTSQITITGAGVGQTTIDANQLDRIFEIAGGATLSLSGMTLTGGLANHGGAVLNGGSLNLSDVRLTGNQATANGGAISTGALAGSNYVATLIATNTEFVGNSAPSVSPTAGTVGWGGALFAIGGRVTLTNSLFHQNTAGMEGGAITSGGGATVTINNSTFTENSSGQGGAILFLSGNVTINDSTFIGNRAVTSGGAIRSSGTTLTVNRGLFEDNRTTQMTTFATNLEGGAIAVVHGGLTTIDGTEFRNNASWRGGALYAWSAGLTVRNSLFEGNTARPDDSNGRGGAVFANTNASVDVINSTLVGNSSHAGGALMSSGASARWVNNTVTGNTTTMIGDFEAINPGAVDGGILWNSIVAGNVGDNNVGTVTSQGGNLIGYSTYFPALPSDLQGTPLTGPIDPHLLPLADNGGPTPTMALSNASPARDRGLWIWPAPLTDARGMSRSGTTLDAGAYEFQNLAITASPFFGTTEEDTPLVGQLQSSDPDGDPGIFELYPIPAHFPYTMTLQPNGQFVLSPAPNYTGLMVFFYRVKDGHGSTTDWLRSEVTITPVNDPPTAEDQTFTVPENVTGFVGSIAFVNDGPYPTFGEIISGNENNAFYVIGNNIYVNRPELMDFETQSSFSFGVRFTDGSGLTDTATITINLTDVDVPQVFDTYFGVYENAAVGTTVINLQLNANPEPGQTVIFSLEDDPTGGAFALNPLTGALTVANTELLEAMFNEAQPFTYFPIKFRTTDSSNPALTRVQNAEFRIINANDTPVIADQTFSIRENAVNGTAVGTILASDEDPGQTRTFALVSSTLPGALAVNAATGAITIADGSLLDHEGIGSITMTVSVTDNGSPALTATKDLVVTITEANDAPVIANQSFAINENSATGTSVGQVIASDVNAGQSLTYAIASTTRAGLFAINAATGEITVADSSLLNYEAASSVTLTIRVTDSASPALSTTGTVTVNVGNLNEAPVAPNYAFSVNENAAFNTAVGTVTATDPDAGTTLTYWLGSTTLPGVFGVNPTNGQITVINNSLLNFEAVTSVTLTVNITDGGNPELSTTSQVTIAINDINEAPVVNAANFHVAENSANGTSVGFVTVTDPEVGQTHSYSLLSDSSGGAFSINSATGEITVANRSLLNHEVASSYTLRVRAADSGTPWLTGVRDFVISVDDVNEAPVLNNQTFYIAENSPNGTLVGTLAGSDVDAGQSLTYMLTSTSHPGLFNLNPSTGEITVSDSSQLNFETTTIVYAYFRVTDSGAPALSDTSSVAIVISNVNDAPRVANQSFTIAENRPHGTVAGRVVATDEDAGQSLRYSLVSASSPGFAVDNFTGDIVQTFLFSANYEAVSTYTLQIRVTDTGSPAQSSIATVTVHITDVNELPLIEAQTMAVVENTAVGTVVGTVIASDLDQGQQRTFSLISSSVPGALSLNSLTGEITVANSSALNFESLTSILLNVRVTDNGTPALSASNFVTVNITNANERPVIANRSFSVPEMGSGIIGQMTSSDPDAGQSRIYSITSTSHPGAFGISSSSGEIFVINGNLLNFESESQAILEVTVTDNGAPALSATATVTIAITDVNEAPAPSYYSYSVAEHTTNGAAIGAYTTTDVDAGQTLTYAIISSQIPGAVSIDSATGVVRVADSSLIDFEARTTFQILVSATDNGNPSQSSNGLVTFHIADINEAPIVADVSLSVPENSSNGAYVGRVLGSDVDAGQSLVYAITASNLPGAFSIDSVGRITVANRSLLNYEVNSSADLEVTVTDNGSPAQSTAVRVLIAITDVNEAPTVGIQNYVIPENLANGTVVGQVIASDDDVGQTLSYVISSSQVPGAFGVDPVTGEITIADTSLINFESRSTIQFLVTVADNGTPALWRNAQLTFQITDVNESPVVLDQSFTIRENPLNGWSVGDVVATDPDGGQSKTFFLVSDSSNGAFVISSTTGHISVANGALLNFEAQPVHTLQVRVMDNGSPSLSDVATVTVHITDVNESPVTGLQSLTIPEHLANGTVIGTVVASDPDAGQTLNYQLTVANLPGAFAVNAVTGELSVADGSLIDFETFSTTILVGIQVTDNGTPALYDNATFVIRLSDVNETPVIGDQAFSIAENSSPGTVVGRVIASDVDAGQSLSYFIASSSLPGAFTINASTGHITVADSSLLNYEVVQNATLQVAVSDNGNPAQTSSATISIAVTNVNERPTVGIQTYTITENLPNGTVVGQVIASDVDAGQVLSYAITSSQVPGAFAVNSVTGEITIADSSLIDFESRTTIQFVATVTDNGTPVQSNNAQLTFHITNANDAPTITNQSFTVAENSVNGTIVGSVASSDVDAGQSLTYSIVSGNTGGAFAINAATGRITVASAVALDFETTPSFALTVRVTDNGHPGLSSTATVTINLTDIIEAIVVGLDVVPGDATNSIRLTGKYDVAILSTATFDARTVNVSTIRFGKNGTEDSISRDKKGNRIFSYRDVNGDGRLDLVVNITNSLTGLGLTDTLAKLSGLTDSGLQILGSSSVRVRR